MPSGRFFPVQTIDFGRTGSPLTFSHESLPAGGQLGMLVEWSNRVFRLVQLDTADAVDLIDGGTMYWKDKASFQVTADLSDSEDAGQVPAGGCHVAVDISAFSSSYYIFVQCGGDQAAVVVDANAVAGDVLFGNLTTADNSLRRSAQAATNDMGGDGVIGVPVGVALSTRGNTTSDNGATVGNSAKVRWLLGNLI